MSKIPATVFGARLREARRRAGLPQDQVGVAVGLDEGTSSARISRYESGVHEPPFDTAKKLAKVLSVPVAFFYADEDDLARLVLKRGELSLDERAQLNHFLKS